MVRWKLLTEDEAQKVWDQNLQCFSDYTLYQTFSWSKYKRTFGWKPYHWVAFNNKGSIIAMMQGLLQKYSMGFGLVWSAGGPIGDIAAWDKSLQQTILQTTGSKRVCCRFFSQREYQMQDALKLKELGWTRSSYTINSGSTMHLNLMNDEDHLMSNCSKNWRHNLKRAIKNNLSIKQWVNPDIDKLLLVYSSMQSFKNLKRQYSMKEIENIFDNLGNKIILYRCDDEHNTLVALRGCAIIKNKGWDLFAATTEQGRKLYASYALFWTLIQHCKEMGVQYYNLGGIDPIKNPGVYNFKKGTGAVPVEYLGEWDWASSDWLRVAVNWAIRLKGWNI